ncbi:sensor domain-containing diguanylate cyclase [Sodalinema gerasimenkoae]|uniref:sensor domain-containing diguanylate cyclase n=1 Tax=Sodalinema gerasimenkoae TaxID=2862348 RepID=UPI0013595E1A|nr:diguanylate cyclase [Sodalinema gerasimenkoae]
MTLVPSNTSVWDLFEHLCKCVCRFDADGQIIIANAGFYEAFPLPNEFEEKPSELTTQALPSETSASQTIFVRLLEGDRPRFHQACRSLSPSQPEVTLTLSSSVTAAEAWQWTVRARFTESGEVLEYQALAHPLGDRPLGDSNLCRCEVPDVTVQEAHRYHLLTHHAPVGIFQFNTQGGVTFVNPSWCKITGRSLDEALGQGWTQALHPDDRDRIVNVTRHINEEITGYEFRFVTPQGQVVWVLGNSVPLWDEFGNFQGCVGTILDITEQKQAQKQESQLKQLSRALEQCGDNVIITNREGKIVYVNSGFERLTGYTQAEALGATPSILRSGLHPREFYRNLWNTIHQGQVFYAVFTNRKKSGELFAEQKTITPLRDESGQITHYISTGKDVTERQRAEERLEQVNRCFLNFSSDPLKNIGRLTALCGTLLEAEGAVYQRSLGDRLDSVSTWGNVSFEEQDNEQSLVDWLEDCGSSMACPRLETPGDTWYEPISGVWRTLVRTGDRVVGLLSLGYAQSPEQSADDRRLLGIIATAIAIEEEQHRVAEALRRQMERERALSKLSHHIHRSLELSEILPATAKAVREFLGSDSVLICSLNERATQATVVAKATILDNPPLDQIVLEGFSLKTNCLEEYKQTQYVTQLQIKICHRYCELEGFEESKTHIIAPILQSTHLWGIIIAQHCRVHRQWTESEQEFLRQVATQLGIATQQSKLYEELKVANGSLQKLATIDGLTQVANRRQFDDFLAQSWQTSLEQQQPLGIILCDIDFFKPYNDTYGHQAGDDCLKQVAGAISETVTAEDSLVARYGGEEFVIVVNGAKYQRLITLVQEIRRAVESLQIPHRSSNAHPWVTLSVGAARLIPRREWTSEDLLRRADQALYEAKAEGRNCGRIAKC